MTAMSLMQTPFLKQLADEVSPLQERVIFHPLFAELYEGKLSLEQLRGYTVQA
ncbi:MAG: hypothetical protein HY347_09390, partial [candidate division NC10 bacterium]|nr:hypothetical protein [candidate division NC10 bacterium]